MRLGSANNCAAPNAGGRRLFAIRTSLVARVSELIRWTDCYG